MERPALMAAVAKRGESVLRFAHIVNEMKILRPEGEGFFSGAGLQLRMQSPLLLLFLLLPFLLFLLLRCLGMTVVGSMATIIITAQLIVALWYFIFALSFSQPFADDAQIAIERAISKHGLPRRDTPSAQQFTDAFDRTKLGLSALAPPSSHSNGCDLLNNPGTNSCHILARACFMFDNYFEQTIWTRS